MKRTNNYYSINPGLKFKITEAYKAIRTNVSFSLIEKKCKRIIITSSRPSEGKSTMSVNIAVSMAQTEARVLLIDADLRRPKVHRFLNLKNSLGITNYLSGMNKLDEIIRDTSYPNLKIITAGSLAPNPSELLSSELFSELLDKLEKDYDYIFIDSTPINVVSDALPVVKLCHGVIMVVREKISTYTELDNALKKLELIDAKVLGLILNGASTPRHHYYTYNDSYATN